MSPLEPNVDTPIEEKQLSADEVFNFISEDGDEKPASDEKPAPKPEPEEKKADEEEKEKEEDDEVVDELADLEAEIEELEEPSKDKLEVVAPARRRDILKKYPTLFKDFPYLEKAYYREQQFTQVFPTIDEAKDALDKAETLANFETDIVGNGNQTNVLKLIKDNNPHAFAKVVDDYLDNLAQIDEGAYYHVIGNLSKQTIKAMWDEGKARGDEQLLKAAVELNKFLFNSSVYKPPQKLAADRPPEEKKQLDAVTERERGIVRQAFEAASGDVQSKVNNYFKTNIEANIDPKKNMTDYVRKNAVRDAIDKIQDLIERDSRFKTLTDRLWVEASKSNFSKPAVDKIIKAFTARGKGLLAPVVRSARNEALKGSGKRVSKEAEIVEEDNGDVQPERERSRSSKKPEANKIPKGMSTLDALNSMMD